MEATGISRIRLLRHLSAQKLGRKASLPFMVIAVMSGILAWSASAQPILYVADDAPPNGDGLSWDTAFQDLQSALDMTQQNQGVREIWIAAGHYVPTKRTNENDLRSVTYDVPRPIDIIGSFCGTESHPEERSFECGATVVSGDLLGNDQPNEPWTRTDNAYHVMMIDRLGLRDTAELDGLLFTGGNANVFSENEGGGLTVFDSDVHITRCKFRRNIANVRGAGVFASNSRIRIDHSGFYENEMTLAENDDLGGTIAFYSCLASVSDCNFTDNLSQDDYYFRTTGASCVSSENGLMLEIRRVRARRNSPGAFVQSADDQSIILSDCDVFAIGTPAEIDCAESVVIGSCSFDYFEEDATVAATMIEVLNSRFEQRFRGEYRSVGLYFLPREDEEPGFIWIDSCEFTKFSGNGAAVLIGGLGTWVINCLFQDNEAGRSGGMAIVDAAEAWIEDCHFENNVATHTGSNGGGLRVNASTINVNSCTFIENEAEFGGGLLVDGVNGTAVWDAHIDRCTFTNNIARTSGGGAYSFYDESFHITNSLFTWNEAASFGGAMQLYAPDSEPREIFNCTLVSNVASLGGGISVYNSQANVKNSVLWDNWPEGVGLALVDAEASVTYSIIEDDWPDIGNMVMEPKFTNPGAGDYRLRAGSPAIDASDSSAYWELGEEDLDGQPRLTNDPGMPDAGLKNRYNDDIADLGCYEFQGETEEFVMVHPVPGVTGQMNLLQCQNAPSGSGGGVTFVYGFAPGLTDVPNCFSLKVFITKPRILGRAVIDNNGYSSFPVFVPTVVSGMPIYFQGVHENECEISNRVRYRFP